MSSTSADHAHDASILKQRKNVDLTPTIVNDDKTKAPSSIISSYLSDPARILQYNNATFAFLAFVIACSCSSAFGIIADCDEVFNYWEPTHYLSHGFGLQTWEYSPEYAIRSWFYVGIHAVISQAARILPFATKVHEFYALRYMMAIFCAYCETQLYRVLAKHRGPIAANIFLCSMCFSTGMFQAASSFLPSSFAMYFTMLGMAYFAEQSSQVKGISCFAVAALLGWPFSIAMAVPYVLSTFYQYVSTSRVSYFISFLVRGLLSSVAILATIVAIDSLAYRKLAVVPANIVLYNVFSGSGKGPNIFGTEPWWFYCANLLLNFNLVFMLSLISAPLLITTNTINKSYQLASTSLFYLWFGIFTLQPHKEERFMYVAYPALCWNAAITFDIVYNLFNPQKFIKSKQKTFIQPLSYLIRLGLIFLLPTTCILSLSRSISLSTGYSAPLHVYSHLDENAKGNVCIGKEWYRFPSSYFLPSGTRAKFVKSSFSGLLPGEFIESSSSSWGLAGTWTMPQGMNDENIEDFEKYVDISTCDYMVDSYFDGKSSNALEPDYVKDEKNWSKIHCGKFLDASTTPTLARIFYVPFARFQNMRRWGEYCLLKRR